MLHLAQGQHGKLPWSQLFKDAERLADGGFPVPRRMAEAAASRAPQALQPDAVAYFTKPDGTKVQPGDILKNPAYAATVRRIAAEGPKALLEGKIAQDIVDRLHQGPLPGTMTLKDLASYKPKASSAVCRPYRVYVVCVPPAPSGGPAVLEGLGLLQRTDIAAHPNDVQGWYLFSQASRLMYADRDRYFGDPDFVDVPTEGLLDPAYLDQRAKLIDREKAGPAPQPGRPKGAGVRAPDRTLEPGGTTHFVIVDAEGNAVSMTTTVESIFGDGRMVDGFFLNNQLTDFSFSPRDEKGRPVANAVAAGKRPRSSMTPAILLASDGRFAGAIGSAGGNAIIAYVAKNLVASIDWNESMQAALAEPNLVARGSNFQGEVSKFSPAILAGLRQRGIDLRPGQGEDSGVTGVLIRNGKIDGGADPRREGVVLTLPR
jgi:gamma-glutamyltranspeptidase/glutathione hydrolase